MATVVFVILHPLKMHNMKRFSLLFAILFVVFCGFSQSLLWKVTGKKLQSPSYLYGTIHIQDQRVFNFDTLVWEKFHSCDAFAMEILMDEINPAEMRGCMYMPKGKLLSEMMPAEDFAMLDSICKKKLGATAYLMNTMKPFFVASAMQQSEFSQDMETALDLYFLKKAREAGKLCYGVEKFQVQVDAIDAIKLKDQIKMLSQSLHDTTTADTSESQKLLEVYLAADLDKMLEMSNDASMPAKFNKIFLIDRNVGMAKNFEKIAKEHSLFCAVGAAHLGGEKGVIALLRKKGYTVEPVITTGKP